MQNLEIQTTERSRLPDVDFDNLGFGGNFADHMFSMVYQDGRWTDHKIVPYGPIPIAPGTGSLHYSQSAFEGLKAFHGADGVIRIFRPDMNAKRLANSCERLCLPEVDERTFKAAIRELVQIDKAWIPQKRGQALYIRPLIFGDEEHLDVRPSNRYRFIVMTCPVRAYYGDEIAPVALDVQNHYTRAAPGGVGESKTGGNYAAALLPGEKARASGFNQALWLDGVEHRYVEEVGQMNIFFRMGDTVVTPDLRGTILPGVTRDSVITLLHDRGITVEERRIDIDEVAEGIRSGHLTEAFGAGTAAVISPVGQIAVQGERLTINDNKLGPLTSQLYDAVTAIQYGEVEDTHNWNMIIGNEGAQAAAE